MTYSVLPQNTLNGSDGSLREKAVEKPLPRLAGFGQKLLERRHPKLRCHRQQQDHVSDRGNRHQIFEWINRFGR